MKKSIYEDFNKIHFELIDLLGNYTKSRILQEFFIQKLNSIFYATLIDNFFRNLNKEIVKEYNLPWGKIGEIKKKYATLLKTVNLALSLLSSTDKRIDVKFYNNFKFSIKKNYPEFIKIIIEIEKEVDIKKAKIYLKEKEKELRSAGKSKDDFNAFITTKALELFIKNNKHIPEDRELDKFLKSFIKDCVPMISEEFTKSLKSNSKKMLDNQRKYQKKFENSLYKLWRQPLDLFESLIRISFESSETHKDKLFKNTNDLNNTKYEALIKIHSRALQISNEILVLLKSGYADGAIARWRSLHELVAITLFLLDSDNRVSKRYLDHEIVRRFKEAKDYSTYHKKLGYPPIERKEFNKIKREKKNICDKYGDRFQDNYGWIPSSTLSDRNFRALEKYVNQDNLRPFYNLSCDIVHGGAKGFYRLGLMDHYQEKILLVGASNFGLADPLQLSALSLTMVSSCLLILEPDFESVTHMDIMRRYVDEICMEAVAIQKEIEIEELKNISQNNYLI